MPPPWYPSRIVGPRVYRTLRALALLLGCTAFFCGPSVARHLRGDVSAPEALSQNALNTILGDVQQEIAAGSNATTAGSSTIYLPKVPATAVPSLVGSTGTGGLENLLKRSVFNQPFYPLTNYTPPGSNRAANLSTGVSSLNGFAVLPARWNRPLLLLKANGGSSTDLSPINSGANAFVVPDWVLVARDGSNPTAWNANLQTSPADPTTVVGRYAYTIYDEGGLLDMTTAGHASGTDSRTVGYKDSLASADLTQVALTQTQIDSVVDWRNSHTFAGRQDLISFLTQTIATTAEARATLQNSLWYLGTFSRGLNQPSYAPVSRADPTNPRPLIQPSAAAGGQPGGGNNVGDNYPTAAAQDVFSPSLLAVRVAAGGSPQWSRYDGTPSVVGEPLVKSRFPLQRLSWLSYKGPAATSGDGNLSTLINTYGIPLTYVQKGTDANIRDYFGLRWDATNHVWKYNVHNRNGTSGAIRNLQELVGLREPDFFELLKASVDPGALGKASTSGITTLAGDVNLSPLNFDFKRDISLDAAIIQLGANIIDQYDLDGYPTRIVFDDGSGNSAREFRGVENLPYIYRIRTGALKVRESNPVSERPPTSPSASLTPYLHSGTQASYTVKPLVDTGAGVIMSVPDIWNLHDQNSSLGSPGPGQSGTIRLVANSATPDTIYANTGTANVGYSTFYTGGYVKTDGTHGSYRGTSISNAVAPDATAATPIPYFTRVVNFDGKQRAANQVMSGGNGGFNYPHAVSLTTTSYLTFKVPTNNTLYHEPTLLGQADPSGPSALTMVVDPSNLDIIDLQAAGGGKAYVSGTGIKSITGLNPLGVPGASATSTQGYIGLALGTYPLRWVGPRWSGSNANTLWNYSDDGLADAGQPVPSITYSLQYQDPAGGSSWVSYDEKYVDSDLSFVKSYDGQLVQPGGGNYTFVDPRTPRFGSPTENNISGLANVNPYYRAPLNVSSGPATVWANTWLDYSGKLLSVVTEKPDTSSGFGSNFRGAASGDWGGYAAPGLHVQSINTIGGVNAIFFQTGLLAQNNPYFPSDGLRFSDDAVGGVGARDANFWSDPDGVVRRAMGGYVTSGNTTGQPLATATTFNGGVGTATVQGQSRPIVLNRPFRSVAELGSVFSGNPWKNIDFSAPESAYSELLDVFCVTEPDNASVLTTGKLNLNTRQPLALKSVLTGAYTDEQNSSSNSPSWSIAPLAAADADSISRLLVARTSVAPPRMTANALDSPQPLLNLGDLVGRWNGAQTISGMFTPALGSVHNVDGSRSYDGFSADLTTLPTSTGLSPDLLKIPRLRESAVRALANVGNTRVWNLMIDLIAQTGEYPQTSVGLDQFVVEGSQRCWLHVAVDRLTGEVLDQSLESVPEVPPTDVASDNLTVSEGQPVGTPVGALSAADSNQASTLSYALVNGIGGNDNAAFAIDGNILRTAAVLRYLDKNSYGIRVRVRDQDSLSFEKAFTVTVLPGPYTQWKITNFVDQANDPAVAGDLVDADHDGMVNILEYALGTSPVTPSSPGVSLQRDGNTIKFSYIRLSAAVDVSTHAYWSSDLTNPNGWTTQGITETLLSDDGTLQRWQATLPTSSRQSAFFRLQVTKP